MAGIEADPEAVCGIYEEQVAGFDARRGRNLFERRWLERFAASLPPGGRVLDLGCGAGQPIAEWLMGQGFQVTGLDAAPAMITIAKDRWPGGDWRVGDMRALDLDIRFDGIIAWNSLFHLTASAQRLCLARIADHLVPGGTFLFTAGPDGGEVTGKVGPRTVYHASLSPAEYATVLEDNNLRLTAFMAEDPETSDHTVLMARRREGAAS
jgi:SAM-dependent methyltransferase